MTTNPDRQTVRELLDACRAHSDDLQLPELRELAAAIQSDPELESRLKKGQQIDDLIGSSLREVPVPEGLESRLLAALANGEPRDEMLAPELDAELDAVAGVNATRVPAVVPTPRSTRWQIWSLASVAAAAALIAVCWSLLPHERSFATQDDVAFHTGQWIPLLSSDWKQTPAPATHPLPGRLASVIPWQQVPQSSDSFSVVCYDVSLTKSSRQYLFVCSTSHSATLPKSPPHIPVLISVGSQDWSVGGWTSERPGFVYSLAIEGSAKKYREVTGASSNMASADHRPVPST